jgi:hypothetical protein
MSSIGVTGISTSESLGVFFRRANDHPPMIRFSSRHVPDIAFKANLRKPLAWHASISE